MYERRNQPLLSKAEFRKRVGRHGLVALGIVALGLGLGVAGYHFFTQLGWIDSLLNASMIFGRVSVCNPSNFAKRGCNLYFIGCNIHFNFI